MRAKDVRRNPPPPPRPSRSTRDALILAISGVVVVVVAVVVVLSLQHPATSTPTGSAVPSLPVGSAVPSEAALASGSPEPSVPAPALEALLPKAVNGTTMRIQSAKGATALGGGPSSRALDAAVTALGKTPTDLEVALADDASGALDLSVLGFRIPGIDPAKLLPAVLDGWLAANAPGVKTSTVTILGTPTTEVSYGTGAKDYVFVHGDAVLVVETADTAVPAEALSAITGAPLPSSAPATLTPSSPAPSAASPSGSPAAS